MAEELRRAGGWLRRSSPDLAFLAAMSIVATFVGAGMASSGLPLWRAALFGALTGFFAVWWPLHFGARLLMRLRGGPFVPGTRVRLRSGAHAGQRGEVTSDDQWTGVALDDGRKVIVAWNELEADR